MVARIVRISTFWPGGMERLEVAAARLLLSIRFHCGELTTSLQEDAASLLNAAIWFCTTVAKWDCFWRRNLNKASRGGVPKGLAARSEERRVGRECRSRWSR